MQTEGVHMLLLCAHDAHGHTSTTAAWMKRISGTVHVLGQASTYPASLMIKSELHTCTIDEARKQ